MKKNDWILLVSVLGYGYLFYDQFAGVNFLVFTLLLLSGLFIRHKNFFYERATWIPLFGAVSSAICITLYGDALSVFTNVCSLALLGSRVVNPQNSLLTSFLHTAFSFLASVINMIKDAIVRSGADPDNQTQKGKRGVMFYVIPMIVLCLFIAFYRGSSLLFKNLTDHIQLDFVSIEWIFFCIGGLILLYPFYYSKQLKFLFTYEQSKQDGIDQSGRNVFTLLGATIDLDTERKSGVLMLVMLNLLLLVVNLLDMQFLVLGSALPEGMTYSELVHQGIGSIIMSIVTAIVIILWYFRGEQNFSANKTLRLLAFIWIAQNILMIASNVYKNCLYIEDSALTYKRIGVFIYLLLATIGLVITFMKIKKVKSNWYLLKMNVVGGYLVLVLSCFVNWDLCIVRYNINQSAVKHRGLDTRYLASLSNSVIPDLYMWMANNDSSHTTNNLKKRLDDRIINLIEEKDLVDWRSYSVERSRIDEGISKLFETQKIDGITLHYLDLTIPHAEQLKKLTVQHYVQSEYWIHKLGMFPGLEELILANNHLSSIQGLPVFPNIKTLNLRNNTIEVVKPITGYSTLEELDIANNKVYMLPDMKNLTRLRKLNLSNNGLQNIDRLSSLVSLEYLDLSNNSITNFSPLVKLPMLKELHISKISNDQKLGIQKILPNVHLIEEH